MLQTKESQEAQKYNSPRQENNHAVVNKISNHLNNQLKDRGKSQLKKELFEVENKLKLSPKKEREKRDSWAVENIKIYLQMVYLV